MNAGNQFIVQLMGVNAEQFRQLFILPQGEFKKFLQSNSKDKQSILRTLFNSERFEEIRSYLMDSVKMKNFKLKTDIIKSIIYGTVSLRMKMIIYQS